MHVEEIEQIEHATGLAMRAIWEIPDKLTFAREMTNLTWSLWAVLRDDAFPPPSEMDALAEHFVDCDPSDPGEFIQRLLSYKTERRTVQ